MTDVKATNITWHEGHASREDRQALLKQQGATLWFTGLSASGKSTFAFTLEHALVQRGRLAYVLDGDNIRHGLNKNLGFSAADREENIRRADSYAQMKEILEKQGGFVRAWFKPSVENEKRIKEETKATVRCIPFDQPGGSGKCIYSGEVTQTEVLFAVAY